jgi:hypothetical protein
LTKPTISEDPIKNLIIETVKKEKPQTTKQLITLMHDTYTFPEEKILNAILELEKQNLLQLTKQQQPTPQTTRTNLFSQKTAWYWIAIAIAITAAVTVFVVPDGVYPLGYLRIVLGAIFVLFMPGFVLIRVLFPAKIVTHQNLDALDYAALSLGISIAIVAATGLLLNYLPWGLSLTSITISLLALTIIVATAAMLHERQLNTAR